MNQPRKSSLGISSMLGIAAAMASAQLPENVAFSEDGGLTFKRRTPRPSSTHIDGFRPDQPKPKKPQLRPRKIQNRKKQK